MLILILNTFWFLSPIDLLECYDFILIILNPNCDRRKYDIPQRLCFCADIQIIVYNLMECGTFSFDKLSLKI